MHLEGLGGMEGLDGDGDGDGVEYLVSREIEIQI